MHHWTRFYEQPRQFSRLSQRTTAILAQIDNHTVNLLCLQLFENYSYISGGTAKIILPFGGSLKITIEGRNLYHSYTNRCFTIWLLYYSFLSRLVFQFNLVAYQLYGLSCTTRTTLFRHNLETHNRAFRAAYLVDNIL